MRYSRLLLQSGMMHILETYQQGKKEGHAKNTRRDLSADYYIVSTQIRLRVGRNLLDRVQPVEVVTTVTERTSKYCMN